MARAVSMARGVATWRWLLGAVLLTAAVAAQGAPSTPHPLDRDRATVRAAVDEVFTRPDLQRGLATGHGNAEQAAADLMMRLARAWRAMQRWLVDLARGAPALYWLLIVALAGLLALLLWHLVTTFRGAMRVEPAARGSEAIAAERVRHYGELRETALAMAAQGRFGEAARTLLLALLALLEERRVLHVARGWTIREIIARLHASDGASGLQVFGLAVERAAYGGAPPTADEFTRLAGIVERVASQVRDAPLGEAR